MEAVEREIRQWLEQVVIGLNLCPFAGGPYRNGLVRIAISQATTEAALLADLRVELERLDATPGTSLETTLLVVVNMLSDFEDYNQFLDQVDYLLGLEGWEGVYQVASFHPHYRFAKTRANDPGNLTNRSPWPILHVIREASIDAALRDYSDPENIPLRNIERMKSLTTEEIQALFPWLDRK